jgi:lysophospholipase L1-like esterase
MMTARVRKISIYIGIAAVLYLLAWGAERAARKIPQLMLPHWQIRYFVKNLKKSKLVPDAEIGFLMAPNQEEEVRTPDFTFVRVTDSKGFPNKDPWPAQADIVILGDSLVVGEGVGVAGGFSQLIAKMLPNKKLINLGIPAAGPERQYPIYRRFGVGLRPRLVVSCLYLASDFDNDIGFRSWLRLGQNSDYNNYRLRFREAQDKRPAFDLARLFERSWLLGMARDLVMRSIPGGNHFPDHYLFPDGTEVLLDKPTIEFAAEAVAAQDERIGAMVKSVETLRDLVARNAGNLLVMLIPSKEELFGVQASVRNLNIVSRTRQRLEDAKLPVLDLYPAMLKGGGSRSPYFSRDIHLNEYGNRIVAEQFAAWFNGQASGTKLIK